MVPGLRALFSGQVSRFRDKLQLTHPEFEPIEESEGVRPFLSIYPATQGFDSWQIGRCVRQVLELLADPTDPLPESLRRAEGLSELGRALRRIHLPETEADQYIAKNRLVWDEAMGVQLALALRRQAGRPAAGGGEPARVGWPAGGLRRPAALHPDRRPAVGRRRDRGGSGVRGPDEPAGAGRRRRGQDGRGAAGDAAGRRQRTSGRHAGAHRGARRAARPLAAVAARAARPGR